MGTFGMDEELNAEKEKAEEKIVMMPEKKRKPFAYWNVGEREYRLKLTTEQIWNYADSNSVGDAALGTWN